MKGSSGCCGEFSHVINEASVTPLTFACGVYDRTVPLFTREVTVEGVDLTYVPIDEPRQIFDRMSSAEPFDVSPRCRSRNTSAGTWRAIGSVRRAAGLSVARLPARHDHRQPQARSLARRSGRQTHRRPALYDDGGRVHSRPAATRLRCRPLRRALGAGRDQPHRRSRRPARTAAAETGRHRDQHHRPHAQRAA